MSTQPVSPLFKRISALAIWSFPLLLIAQFLGNYIKMQMLTTTAFLSLYVFCIFAFSGTSDATAMQALRPDETSEPRPSLARIAGGLGATILGAAIYILAAIRLFYPKSLGVFFDHSFFSSTQTVALVLLVAAWPLSLGSACAWEAWRQNKDADADAPRASDFHATGLLRLGALLGLGMVIVLASGQRVQRLPLVLTPSVLSTILLWASAISLSTLAIFTPRKGWLWPGVLLPCAVSLRVVGLEVWEINPATRDMLALLISAHDSFLSGENPYALHQMQANSVIPLTYLPGMWMAYLIPRLVGLDIRLISVFADAVVMLSLWWAAKPRLAPTDRTARTSTLAPAQVIVLLFGSIWLFLPTVHWNGIYAEPNIWWGILALLLASVLREKWWLTAVALALAVSTRHFGIILLPFVMLAMWRALGWRELIPRLALFGAIVAFLWVPFVAWNPETFWFGTFRWLREYGPVHKSWFNNIFGFAGLFYRNDIGQWLSLAQAVSVAVFLAACLLLSLKSRSPRVSPRFFALTGVAYLLFVMFNGLIWYSFYLGAILFVVFAALHAYSPAPETPATDSPTPTAPHIWRLSCVVLALSLLAGGWLVLSLLGALGHPGRPDARAYLSENLQPGDVFVDHSDWRVAFVKGEAFLEDDQRPKGVRVVRDFVGPMTPALRSFFRSNPASAPTGKKLWLVARPQVDAERIASFQGLGTLEDDRSFGKYRLLSLTPYKQKTQLRNELSHLRPTLVAGDDSPEAMQLKNPARPPSASNPWTANSQPAWLQIAPKHCDFGRRKLDMLYIHPRVDTTIRLHFDIITLGESLILSGGIEAGAVRWDRADVDVALYIDGKPVKDFSIPNLPGPAWLSVDTRAWAGEAHEVELRVTTADDRQRWTCLDAMVLGY